MANYRTTTSRPNPAHVALAVRRIRRILSRHGIATARTLEQKISDAGPFNQRMEPHILTLARNQLAASGAVLARSGHGGTWYYLSDSDPEFVHQRYHVQATVYRALTGGKITPRLGQTLEIAVYRALIDQPYDYLGRFKGLDTSQETREKLYRKDEPPTYLGNHSIGGERRLDFLFLHPDSGWAGIEVKNVREWLYPDRAEIRDLISKSVALDCVPRAHRPPFPIRYLQGAQHVWDSRPPNVQPTIPHRGSHRGDPCEGQESAGLPRHSDRRCSRRPVG